MVVSAETLEERLLATFERVFDRQFPVQPIRVAEIEEWDSLSHIRLVMDLESEFGIEIKQESIVGLYSDSGAILSFLRDCGA